MIQLSAFRSFFSPGALLTQVPQWPGALDIGIVNHHFTLFLGAMLEPSSAPACLQTLKDRHMLRMNRTPGAKHPHQSLCTRSPALQNNNRPAPKVPGGLFSKESG